MSRPEDLPVVLGGRPIRPEGPPSWPIPDPDIARALQEAFADGSWGKYHGPHVERLEEALRVYHGLEFALVCGSGTFAMELALRALKIGPGDEVILAGYDFPGNFLNVHAVGAHPVLVDLDPDNWNLAPELIAAAIGSRTRAVIASHLHGGIVPMKAVTALAREKNLAVIEDAAQCPGALVGGRKAGTWGDATILSFGGSKLLTAGRGGALLTSRPEVQQRARTWNHRGNQLCPLSELQAAVLLPQLDKLDQRNALRSQNVQALLGLLTGIPGLKPLQNRDSNDRPGYYKLGFQFDAGRFGLDRKRFLEAMRAEGIALDEGFPALHAGRSPRRYRVPAHLPQADLAHEGMVLLHHPVLLGTPADLAQVADGVRKIWNARAGF